MSCYEGEVIVNSIIIYTCLHPLKEELPNLSGTFVAVKSQQLACDPSEDIRSKTTCQERIDKRYLWLCSSAMKEHPYLS